MSWLWFLIHMLISPDDGISCNLTFFQNFYFSRFREKGSKRTEKWLVITDFILSQSKSSNSLVHRYEIVISPGVFIFLKRYNVASIKILTFFLTHFNSFFNEQLFFKILKFLNAKTEILSCAPPFSHAWDFFLIYKQNHYRWIFNKNHEFWNTKF